MSVVRAVVDLHEDHCSNEGEGSGAACDKVGQAESARFDRQGQVDKEGSVRIEHVKMISESFT